MPSSAAARMILTAISPRLAMSSFPMAMKFGLAVEIDQRLAGHHRILVLDEELHHPPGRRRLHLVEGLHHLDQADDIADGDLIAFGLVDGLIRRRPAIEGPRQRRQDLFDGHASPLFTYLASFP